MSLMLCGCKETIGIKFSCPPSICLQPYDNYTQQEAYQLRGVLNIKFRELYGVEFEFEVLPNKHLSGDLLNDNNTRFRADKIVHALAKDANDNRILIGLTHKDISVTSNGRADWGVLGLSIHGSNACVTSTYRLKHVQRDMWKLVAHEFTHTAYNYSHCPEDNPKCIMKDAKGKADFSKKESFCETCRERLNI